MLARRCQRRTPRDDASGSSQPALTPSWSDESRTATSPCSPSVTGGHRAPSGRPADAAGPRCPTAPARVSGTGHRLLHRLLQALNVASTASTVRPSRGDLADQSRDLGHVALIRIEDRCGLSARHHECGRARARRLRAAGRRPPLVLARPIVPRRCPSGRRRCTLCSAAWRRHMRGHWQPCRGLPTPHYPMAASRMVRGQALGGLSRKGRRRRCACTLPGYPVGALERAAVMGAVFRLLCRA